MGHNELLLRQALRGRDRQGVVLSVKFGALRDPAGGWVGIDTRPAAVRNFLAYTLRRLGTDYVDIYYIHHVDHQTPLDEMLRAFDDLVRDAARRARLETRGDARRAGKSRRDAERSA